MKRFRRLRTREAVRRAVRETRLSPAELIAPLFVCSGDGIRRDIPSLPGHAVLTVDRALDEARELARVGVGGVLLFGSPESKDEIGSAAWDEHGPVPSALRAIANEVPALMRWADVCLCGYTSHGHCGVPETSAHFAGSATVVNNDASLPLLARTAVCYARAGADVVAPSDMMDGRVAAIRSTLDDAGLVNTAICSYAAKFASALYGPFRDAAGSQPTSGDRRGYQMDPANGREAVAEAVQDVREGADIVMVKPALGYGDVVRRVRQSVPVPVAAYNVSGEYAMVKAAAARGWLDETAAMLELLLGIRRAGASPIVTYFAREAAEHLS
jgi:porphobilinogen synthase